MYLVGTGEMKSVEHRNENVCRYQETQNIRAAYKPVLRAVGVDLGRRADDGHGRLEGGHERQREREALHLPISEQELLHGSLTPSGERVVQSDGHRGHQQQSKYDIVDRTEVLVSCGIHTDAPGMKMILESVRRDPEEDHSRPSGLLMTT